MEKFKVGDLVNHKKLGVNNLLVVQVNSLPLDEDGNIPFLYVCRYAVDGVLYTVELHEHELAKM